MKPKFFASAAEFRQWLEKNHDREPELLVGFYKRDSGKPSMTWPESVDEALCFGWIDGVRKRIDDESYTIRFTPRKRGSIWSKINIGRVEELKKQGRMSDAGIRAFEERSEKKSGVYAYENEVRDLDAASEKKFRANKKAWKFWKEQPASYQRVATYWIMNAKQETTRAKRLGELIEESANGRRHWRWGWSSSKSDGAKRNKSRK